MYLNCDNKETAVWKWVCQVFLSCFPYEEEEQPLFVFSCLLKTSAVVTTPKKERNDWTRNRLWLFLLHPILSLLDFVIFSYLLTFICRHLNDYPSGIQADCIGWYSFSIEQPQDYQGSVGITTHWLGPTAETSISRLYFICHERKRIATKIAIQGLNESNIVVSEKPTQLWLHHFLASKKPLN